MIGHHYRVEWEWDDELMPNARDRLDRWRAAAAAGGGNGDVLACVRDRLDDDLDTPGAFAIIDDAATRGGAGDGVAAAAALLGVVL